MNYGGKKSNTKTRTYIWIKAYIVELFHQKKTFTYINKNQTIFAENTQY